MDKIDRIVLALVLLIALTLAGLATTRTLQLRHAAQQQVDSRKPMSLSVAPQIVIGAHPIYRGDPNNAYTLVEFMDYQCPPCRMLDAEIQDSVFRYSGKLRLTVRNFPLKIHRYAFPAAVAAEAAREQGHFWPVHDALIICSDLEPTTIRTIAKAQRLDMKHFVASCNTAAEATVKQDLKEAEDLHLPGTPSLILCCPDRRVVRLSSLDQLQDYIK